MIVYEPGVEAQLPRKARPGRRALAGFLREAQVACRLLGDVSVLLAGDETVRSLNRQYRRKNKTTDVLSFPAPAAVDGVAGDLVISLPTALEQASECGHPLDTEVRILLLHGLLHLAGYDHETDDGAMQRRERRLRRQLGLPSGLIERATAAPRAKKATAR